MLIHGSTSYLILRRSYFGWEVGRFVLSISIAFDAKALLVLRKDIYTYVYTCILCFPYSRFSGTVDSQ